MLSWRYGVGTVLLLLGTFVFASHSAIAGSVEGTRAVDYTQDQAVYQLWPTAIEDSVAVITRLHFPDDADQKGIDTFLLAGFSLTDGGPPHDLVVRWRKDGWFQLWTLGIDASVDILPAALRPARGSGPWSGHKAVTLESGKFPEPGHVYETTVSYAPAEGYLAVSIFDVTTQEPFYRGVIELLPLNAPVYVGSGLSLVTAASDVGADRAPTVTQVRSGLIPVGLKWRLLEQSSSGLVLPVTRVDRSNPLAIEVDSGADWLLPGQLRLVAEGEGQRVVLADIDRIAGLIRLPIDADALPPGSVHVRLEYLLDGQMLWAETRPVGVGVMQVGVEELVVNEAAGTIEGALVLRADGPIEGVTVVGEVTARARSLVEPAVSSYEATLQGTLAVGQEPIRLPFEFPWSDAPHHWVVSIEPHITVGSGVRVRMEVPGGMTLVTGSDEIKAAMLSRVRKQYLDEFLLSGTVQRPVPPQADGSWEDIDYADQSVGGWKALPHLDRLWQMARAYAIPGSVHSQDATLKEQIVRALTYWVENQFRNPNWWFNTIWQPHRLGDILLLMGDAIPNELWDATLQIVRDEVLHNTAGPFTGANLVWIESNRLRLGLLTEDLEMVAHAFDAMASELRVVSFGREGGIQVDGSFHQHGTMLYSGGYGEAFAGELGRLIYVARGTNLFPPQALSVLVDLVLDGQQWFVRGLTFDFNSMGRVLSRQVTSGNAAYLIGLVRTLTALPDVPRRVELEALLDRLTGSGEPLSGNRYFWTSDFMTHHRPGYYVSLKAASTRTLATEIGNYENLKGYHMGDGMMFIMQTGREYDQTFPVWDWEQLPGTTVRHMDHPLLLDGRFLSVRGAGDPASGVSDGVYGAMAMNLGRDGLAARKAWFFFDDEVVALGTDIQVPPSSTVTTSINQTRLEGQVVFERGNEVKVLGPGHVLELDHVAWVYHDGVAYVFPEPAKVSISSRVQTGRWSDINSSYSNQPLSLPMFSMWLDHSGASTPQSYAYIVAPGLEQERVASYARSHGVQVLANESSVQAVWHTDLRQLQAVFWAPGTLHVPSGLSVSVDAPALILLREGDESVVITAGTLERKAGTITVRLERSGGVPWVVEERFSFPDGDYLGRSLTQEL